MEWHHISDPNDPELDRLGERYHLHPLHIEDCRHRDQRSKIEESDGYLFTVMKCVRLDEACEIHTADVDIFLGAGFVITVVEENYPQLDNLIEQVRKTAGDQSRGDQVYYRIV